MFGQNPRLPIDAVFESVREDPTTGLLNKTAIEYIQDLQQVERQAEEEYDRKAKPVNISVGDKSFSKKGGVHKIKDSFETEAYTVIEQGWMFEYLG